MAPLAATRDIGGGAHLFIGQSEVTAQPGWEGVEAVHHAMTSPPGNDRCDENLSETEPRAKLAHGCCQAFAGVLIGHDYQRSEFQTAPLSS